MIVVSVPEPAINGKAMGTTLPLFGLLSGLKKSRPNTISKPIINITMLPATANDCTSNPSKFKNGCPKKRNKIMKAPDAMVAWVERITPPIFSFKEIRIGIEPSISITANKVKVTVIISSTLILAKSAIIFFVKVTVMPEANRKNKTHNRPQLLAESSCRFDLWEPHIFDKLFLLW